MFLTVAGEGDASNSGTLMWDPKIVEDLTDEECECTVPGLILLPSCCRLRL